MKTASVVEFKTHLGRYLGYVTQGETVVVTSHRHPVACLVRPPAGAEDVAMLRPERSVSDLDDLMPVRLPEPVDGLRELMRDRERR
jgi:antitoxin (DNA-binding transcriptional repressor) of toxin-antitoxin stability system